jgi:serine/threonine-protein kinase
VDDSRTRNLKRPRAAEGEPPVARNQPPSEAQYMALLEAERGFSARYSDVASLGQGGMAEVRLCLDLRTERDVAVKRIDKTQRDEVTRARFLREARIQAQLDHPTVVPVYEIGIDDEGFEYFTMKRAVGMALDEILDGLLRGEPSLCARYTQTARLGIFRQVCQGLEYAHGRGIVHRDLKPENVMVGELGEVYVLDWGIAKVRRSHTADALARSFTSSSGDVLGTPGYLAPEQSVDPESVDARADIYALGAILFELLTLEPLHVGDDVDALLESTRLGGDARISVRRPELGVAPELERLCVLATKASPEERLDSVSAVLAVVAGYLDGDRDLALRRALAEQHALTASAAFEQVLAGHDPDDQLRARALRDAGHALALDPQSRPAIEVITRLMALAPANVPSEAAALLAEQERADAKVTARWSTWSYLGFAALSALVLSVVHIRDWLAVSAIVAPLLLATCIGAMRARSSGTRPPAMLAILAILVSISATSTIGSPYLLMPALLAAFATTSINTVMPLLNRPRLWAGLCLLAAGVPMLLQALDMLPVGFVITGPRLSIEHRLSDASPFTIQLTLVAITLTTILVPMFFSYRTARRLRETRTQLVVHLWHLRQLAPG